MYRKSGPHLYIGNNWELFQCMYVFLTDSTTNGVRMLLARTASWRPFFPLISTCMCLCLTSFPLNFLFCIMLMPNFSFSIGWRHSPDGSLNGWLHCCRYSFTPSWRKQRPPKLRKSTLIPLIYTPVRRKSIQAKHRQFVGIQLSLAL